MIIPLITHGFLIFFQSIIKKLVHNILFSEILNSYIPAKPCKNMVSHLFEIGTENPW